MKRVVASTVLVAAVCTMLTTGCGAARHTTAHAATTPSAVSNNKNANTTATPTGDRGATRGPSSAATAGKNTGKEATAGPDTATVDAPLSSVDTMISQLDQQVNADGQPAKDSD
jgi:hypothetical protein